MQKEGWLMGRIGTLYFMRVAGLVILCGSLLTISCTRKSEEIRIGIDRNETET